MSVKLQGRRNSALFPLDSGSKVQTCRRSSSTTFEPLENMVTCTIDLNFLEDPRLLPCGHAFCYKCLNNYMEKLTCGTRDLGKTEQSTFPCPICRAPCFIPLNSKADSFPIAFNHKVILEFLKKYRLNQLSSKAIKQESGATESMTAPNAVRKTSIQVSSQMLNYIVDDLTCRQKDGKIGSADRAVIIDEVNKLLHQLQTTPESYDTKKQITSYNQNNNNYNNQNCRREESSSPSTISPSNSVKRLGRFQAVASRIKWSNMKPSAFVEFCTDDPSYSLYREAENVRINMKRNANFLVVSRGKDCCVMRPGEEYQSIDIKLNFNTDNQIVHRYTLTTNPQHTELTVYKHKMNMINDNRFANLYTNGSRKLKVSFEKITGQIIVDGSNPIKVKYVRFFGSMIYLTGIITPTSASQNLTTDREDISFNQIGEFGILVCCMITDLENQNLNNTSDQPNPFPVVATSSLFYRDVIGSERLDQPIIFGLDIDQSNGDVYVAQPANAMICRLKENDLTRIDRTWYLNDPQLSPYFICFARSDHSIWATCPTEDKIIILDLDGDGYFHFTPSITFSIIPSHIIYTSDDRIVVLDRSKSHLYWITKVRKAICIQRLEFRFKANKLHQIMAVQPVDDEFLITNHPFMEYRKPNLTNVNNNNNKNNANGDNNDNNHAQSKIRGGILCAHDYGCSIIYPQVVISKYETVAKFSSCLNFCHKTQK